MKKIKNIVVFTLIICIGLISTISFAKLKYLKPKPLAPKGLTAVKINSNSVNLNWKPVSYASGYKVYRATPYNSNYKLIATVSKTSYSNTGLTPEKNYWYFVRAYNSTGTSSYSNRIKVKTLKKPIKVSNNKKIVLGFTTYYYEGDKSSYNSIVANKSSIDEIATYAYITDGYGKLSGLVPKNQLAYANSNGIKTFALITNEFDGERAKILLESPKNRQALINNILSSLKLNGYKGVNIDIEGVYPYDRNYYTTFLIELYKAFKPKGYMITISIPAKTSDSPSDSWSGAYDYAKIAGYANQIAIMTYDEHYPNGLPGPVASIGWVNNVMKYALTVIPKEKILLGTAAYGYDWSVNGTKAYSINQMYNLASSKHAPIIFDAVSKTPYFKYTDSKGKGHTAWFENDKSLGYKLDLVNRYNLAGIAVWRLGLEDSKYWTTIKSKFKK